METQHTAAADTRSTTQRSTEEVKQAFVKGDPKDITVSNFDDEDMDEGMQQQRFCPLLVMGNTDGRLKKDDGSPAVGVWYCGICAGLPVPIANPLPSSGSTSSSCRTSSDDGHGMIEDDDGGNDDGMRSGPTARVARGRGATRSRRRERSGSRGSTHGDEGDDGEPGSDKDSPYAAGVRRRLPRVS